MLCVLLLSAAHLYGIHIFQPLVVYAVGEGGILLRSENGADTWTPNVPLQVPPRTSLINTLGALLMVHQWCTTASVHKDKSLERSRHALTLDCLQCSNDNAAVVT